MTKSTEGLGNPSLTAQDPRFGALTIALGYADPKAASVVKGVLDSLGCRGITLVRDGPELFAKTLSEPIDIAVIDWTLRASSGPELVRRLRFYTSHPRRDLPVIQLCPDKFEEYRRLARDAGTDATVPKPFTPRGLLSAVYRVIERPRPFVISPDYVGPDRRNPDTATLPREGAECRTTKPLPLGSVPDAIGYATGSVLLVAQTTGSRRSSDYPCLTLSVHPPPYYSGRRRQWRPLMRTLPPRSRSRCRSCWP